MLNLYSINYAKKYTKNSVIMAMTYLTKSNNIEQQMEKNKPCPLKQTPFDTSEKKTKKPKRTIS